MTWIKKVTKTEEPPTDWRRTTTHDELQSEVLKQKRVITKKKKCKIQIRPEVKFTVLYQR